MKSEEQTDQGSAKSLSSEKGKLDESEEVKNESDLVDTDQEKGASEVKETSEEKTASSAL